ncbi:MAG: hypothetical protein COA45_02865 [Zetaproteobacteria bacterium]|nr:MAG: hypothetical protein COA45_02865 [Zetaproteobacteria bacterium]
MAFIITDIFSIDALAVPFSDESDQTIYPSKAYEIHVELNGKRIQTYGVVWEAAEQVSGCFLSEEMDEHLAQACPDQYTEEAAHKISSLIFQKYLGEELELPLVLWQD